MTFTVGETGPDLQIVAVFENDAAATSACAALRDAGVPDSAIQFAGAPQASTPAEPEAAGGQILSAVMGLFSSAEEHTWYSQTVGSGHAMVVVTPTDEADRQRLVEILARSNPIDFNAKRDAWLQSEYEGIEEAAAGLAVTDAERR